MARLLTWLIVSVATLNVTLQLLVIYRLHGVTLILYLVDTHLNP